MPAAATGRIPQASVGICTQGSTRPKRPCYHGGTLQPGDAPSGSSAGSAIMKKLLLPLALGLATLVALPAAASACRTISASYTLDDSTKTTKMSLAKDTACSVGYNAGGPFMLSSLTIVEPPGKGKLEKISKLRFRYAAPEGYTGPDLFVLKLCGAHNIRGPGCQTIRYEVTVE